MTESTKGHLENCWYPRTNEFNMDCPECMRIWNKFLDDKNIYVASDK